MFFTFQFSSIHSVRALNVAQTTVYEMLLEYADLPRAVDNISLIKENLGDKSSELGIGK